MYARQDAIIADMGCGNSAFIEGLREMGFYVAECARSNYAQTLLSIPSSFNINYLEDLGILDSEQNLREPGRFSIVRTYLIEIGYQSVSFGPTFGFSTVTGGKILLWPTQPALLMRQIQPFEFMLLQSTIIRIPLDVRMGPISNILNQVAFPYHDHAVEQRFILDKLADIPKEIEDQKFVYAHIMPPHPPYIFNPDGSLVKDKFFYNERAGLPSDEAHYKKGYINQVEFVNNQLLLSLRSILEQSENPPIIILQGDHRIRGDNRLQILSAYYLPYDAIDELYPSFSPVNSFRLIFNNVFNAEYPLLEDKSYYSEPTKRFELTEVEELSPNCNIP